MKVNILLSTYNGEQFLAEQIRSIQAQTFTDWTLLIRDDGSTDKTREVIEDFVERDNRIYFINPESHENFGVIKNFYTLLKHDKADYYFFSDQDDIWLPDKLAITLNEAQKYDVTKPLMVYTDLKVVNEDLKVLSESMIRTQSAHANTRLVEELTENTVTGGTALINHALASTWQSLDNIIMHDWYLALLAAALGQLVYIDQPTELYRQHDNNVLGARTLSKRFKNWIRPQLLFEKYWRLIESTQMQAQNLLDFPLEDKDRDLVLAFTNIMSQDWRTCLKTLRRYGLRKNKTFHTFVFTFLIVTKFAYRRN